MAITLVTGLPGHGKTLWTLARLKPLAEAELRPVFHASGTTENGIPGLVIDGWQYHDAKTWFDLPANSYMVIDECQRVFPIRARSSAVPKHVEQLETHRHGGLDLFLITQHPMLIDTNVRKLVDRHFHVVRKFGIRQATVYEFPSGVQDSPEKNKQKNGVVRHEWWFPKKAFGWYQSAEVHTVKARLPMKAWLFLSLFLLIPVLFWFAWHRLYPSRLEAPGAPGAAVSVAVPASAPGRVQPVARHADSQAAGDFLLALKPRIVGLAFTAPAYDALTRPVEAPYPSVCAYSPDFPCRCWSQRGYSLVVPKTLCEELAREPMDPYWLKRSPYGLERPGDNADAGAAVPAVGAQPVAVVQGSSS